MRIWLISQGTLGLVAPAQEALLGITRVCSNWYRLCRLILTEREQARSCGLESLAKSRACLSFAHASQKLLKISEQSWSLAELVHAVVLLAHYHALASFAFGCGCEQDIGPEGRGSLKLGLPGSVCFCDVGNGCSQELLHLNRKRVCALGSGTGLGEEKGGSWWAWGVASQALVAGARGALSSPGEKNHLWHFSSCSPWIPAWSWRLSGSAFTGCRWGARPGKS